MTDSKKLIICMKYFIIAGEASGDLHASNLMHELKKEDSDADFCFLGGDLMKAQGGTMVKHYREMAFMGIIAVVKNARTVLRNMKECKEAITAFKPDVVILIDYPSFNLRIAKFAKEELNIPVYYYISPKIWAWKEFRIKKIKKYVDHMFTILPFETGFYAKHNYPVEYVGNPSVDSVYAQPKKFATTEEFCKKNKLPQKQIIAILPGSRKQEIKACLSKMIEAASCFPEYQVVVAGAPSIPIDFYKSISSDNNFKLLTNQTYELLYHSRVAIVNSGTATLETALIGTPQIVVYHVAFGKVASFLKKIVIKVKYISLVNLIAEKEVVKEFVAHHFTTDNIKTELPGLLFDEQTRRTMLDGYTTIRTVLGEPGTASRAASKIVYYLKQN